MILYDLLGEKIVSVKINDSKEPGLIGESKDYLVLIELQDKTIRFYHDQDCCETVELIDIVGDINDLIGEELLMAEEVVSREELSAPFRESYIKHELDRGRSLKEIEEYGLVDSNTWAFYKFGTIKGYVTFRFLGESNGYYSEEVSVDIIEKTREERNR